MCTHCCAPSPSDAEYDHDAGLEALDRRPGKGKEVQVAREKQRQIKEYNRYNSAVVSWLTAGCLVHTKDRWAISRCQW